jgi:hypothetical protein
MLSELYLKNTKYAHFSEQILFSKMRIIKMKYVEAENPIEEIYRIREAILKEHGGIKEYHKYLRDTQYKVEEAGFHFANFTEEEKRKEDKVQ